MSAALPPRAASAGRSPAAARKRRRLLVALIALALLSIAAALILTAFRDSIVFFHTPSEVAEKAVPGRPFRLGGLVEAGSVTRSGDEVRFRITDLQSAMPVIYQGILPDLFREGQGVVAEGTLGTDGVFRARQVLAKHDETYMPPEVAAALKKSGEWRPGAAPAVTPARPNAP